MMSSLLISNLSSLYTYPDFSPYHFSLILEFLYLGLICLMSHAVCVRQMTYAVLWQDKKDLPKYRKD